jgi:hypothetical protein
MSKLNFNTLLILFTLFVVCGSSTFAQQILSVEKRVLIQELRKLSGSQNINLSVNFTSADIEDTFLTRINKDTELTDKQKITLKEEVTQAKQRMDKQIQDFFADKASIQQLSEDTAVSLYADTFSESDLRELIVFYKTPVGKKSLLFFLSEKKKLTDVFTEAFGQKLQEFTQPMVEKERDLLDKKIKELKGNATKDGIVL